MIGFAVGEVELGEDAGDVGLDGPFADGRWIVFSKGVDGNQPDLYIMNSDGSDVRRVTKSPLWDSRPAWTP